MEAKQRIRTKFSGDPYHDSFDMHMILPQLQCKTCSLYYLLLQLRHGVHNQTSIIAYVIVVAVVVVAVTTTTATITTTTTRTATTTATTTARTATTIATAYNNVLASAATMKLPCISVCIMNPSSLLFCCHANNNSIVSYPSC